MALCGCVAATTTHLALVLEVELGEVGDGLDAWGTPGGPELHDGYDARLRPRGIVALELSTW